MKIYREYLWLSLESLLGVSKIIMTVNKSFSWEFKIVTTNSWVSLSAIENCILSLHLGRQESCNFLIQSRNSTVSSSYEAEDELKKEGLLSRLCVFLENGVGGDEGRGVADEELQLIGLAVVFRHGERWVVVKVQQQSLAIRESVFSPKKLLLLSGGVWNDERWGESKKQ